jgi:hypothetical protein
MKNNKFIGNIDELSPRSPLIDSFFYDLYSFSDDTVTDRFNIGLNGEHVGNDKTQFVNNPDYLCIGCSFTSGEGLPDIYSWPSVIREFTGKTVNNCSMRGAGISWLVYASFDVMKKYGSPKNVFALFPDMERALIYEGKNNKNKIGAFFTGEVRHSYWDTMLGDFVSKKKNGSLEPLEFKDFQGRKYNLQLESVIFQSFLMLDALDSHFEIQRIPFKFSSWTPHVYESFKRIKDKYPSFLESRYWEKEIDTATNHREEWMKAESSNNEMARSLWRRFGHIDGDDNLCQHEPQTESQSRFWSIAADGKHPGLHAQIHFAEYFLGKSIGNDFLKGFP